MEKKKLFAIQIQGILIMLLIYNVAFKFKTGPLMLLVDARIRNYQYIFA